MVLVHIMDLQKQENKDTDEIRGIKKLHNNALLIPLTLYLSPTYNSKNKFKLITVLFHFFTTFFCIYYETSFSYPASHIRRFKMNWLHNPSLLRLSSIIIFYFCPNKPLISDSKFNILQLYFPLSKYLQAFT